MIKIYIIFVVLVINFVKSTKNVNVPKADESLLNKVDYKPSVVGTPYLNKMVKRKLINEIEIKEVIDFYVKTKSIYETSIKFNYTASTIYRRLKQNGIDTSLDKIKHSHRAIKYPTNENYFETIDTRDKAYILGIIFSDGYVTKEKTVRLKLTDIDLLDTIRNKIGHTQPLFDIKSTSYKHKPSKLLVMSNKKIYNDIINTGVCHKKSYNCIFPPLLNLDLYPDFIRGFFDGNGCIHITNNRGYIGAEIKIVATKNFCCSMSEYLKKLGIRHQNGASDKRHDNRIGDIRIRNKQGIYMFFQLIYKNINNQIFLKRKYNKFIEFMTRDNNYKNGYCFK